MPATLLPPEVESKPKSSHGSSGGGFDGGWDGDESHRWGDWGSQGAGTSPDSYRLAMWLGLASILMLFVALSSAYLVRQGASMDWRAIAIPPFLLPNSFLLLASSATLELSRRAWKRRLRTELRNWISVTTLLGGAFLAGQIWIWRGLAAQGIYLSSNPHSSFFYLMTGAHGVHLMGGIIALLVVSFKAWFQVYSSVSFRTLLDVTAIYWHFMGGLWVYLFILLFIWR